VHPAPRWRPGVRPAAHLHRTIHAGVGTQTCGARATNGRLRPAYCRKRESAQVARKCLPGLHFAPFAPIRAETGTHPALLTRKRVADDLRRATDCPTRQPQFLSTRPQAVPQQHHRQGSNQGQVHGFGNHNVPNKYARHTVSWHRRRPVAEPPQCPRHVRGGEDRDTGAGAGRSCAGECGTPSWDEFHRPALCLRSPPPGPALPGEPARRACAHRRRRRTLLRRTARPTFAEP
jgi:hypothetical protein